ncbi:KRI1-like family C-terminal-domain-containing protein [Phascolomyces articulosus]|uniref:KRI1-like family C-terminal-domain-containing protein n=1 Tax=Phascolomyces articulosus TaxID=60185 RepID=A0AAD5JZ16_9FUNG|nr:KRI1-like family C-terminal-domain-containing protein [Phascolomyces articulosus]
MSDEVQVHIREREDESADYQRPVISQPSDHEEASSEDQDESDESEESEDEEEDEDAAMLTPAIDSQILRTIAAIQTRDPKVYDLNKKFFSEQDLENAKQEAALKKKQNSLKTDGVKSKNYTLKDYEREVLLEHGGYVNEEEEQPKSHYQEQRDIKNDFLRAVQAVDSDDEDEEGEEGLGGGLLEKRIKTKEEEEEEDAKYRQFMLQNIAADEASAKAFKNWNENYKENPNVTKDDAFLIDYVLNRGWVEKPSDKKQRLLDDTEKEVEEEHLDEVDRFESKYNFRFEEEDGAMIVSHSRQVDDSVRRKQSKRQKERERKKARREEKLREKNEELARARNLKMKEVRDRLKEIQEITGETIDLDKLDLDGDFDEKYDEQMANMFGEDYYERGQQDETKPTWDDDIDTDMYEDAQEYQDEEEDVMMDADYLPGGDKYKGNQSLQDPNEIKQQHMEKKRKAQELLDDYYSLNFEDIIGGDLPTRYKYRKTEREDYGLTAEEILLADDTELNKYVGMKMLAPYRNQIKHEHEMKFFNRSRRNKYQDFSKHVNEKLKLVDPEGSSKSDKKYSKEQGTEAKKMRKRRGKKKKKTEA